MCKPSAGLIAGLRSGVQFPSEAYSIKMPQNEIERKYSELRKKYKLPEFKDMDFEFEVSDLEETNFMLRAIIRRIAEKLDFYCTMIEEILQPDTSNLYAMHETRYLEEDEKKQMYDLYKKMMGTNRLTIELSLDYDEKTSAEFVNSFITEWKSIKKDLLRFVLKMKKSWQVETDIKEDLGYLG